MPDIAAGYRDETGLVVGFDVLLNLHDCRQEFFVLREREVVEVEPQVVDRNGVEGKVCHDACGRTVNNLIKRLEPIQLTKIVPATLENLEEVTMIVCVRVDNR